MPTLTASSSSSSPRCAPFPCRRGPTRTRGLPPPAAPPAHGGHHGCGRPLGRAAGVVGGGIAAAFFASLERCACVEVRTKEDDDEEAAPLMLRGSPTAATSSGRRRAPAANGKQGKRRGLGCWENDAIN
ncbi:hypothetical protein EJB05_00050, partial [Eragrostis curvula]